MSQLSLSIIQSLTKQWGLETNMAQKLDGGVANANYIIHTASHQQYTLTLLESFNQQEAE